MKQFSELNLVEAMYELTKKGVIPKTLFVPMHLMKDVLLATNFKEEDSGLLYSTIYPRLQIIVWDKVDWDLR